MRILVVDDDEIVLTSCNRVLTAAEYEVILARSASEALEVLGRTPVDLVLLDIIMPERDGFSLMISIKEHHDPMMIVMSGYSTPDTVSRVRELGASRFLPKPFSPQELLASIESVAHD